jgi:two-component system, OmpR family, sensor kinase
VTLRLKLLLAMVLLVVAGLAVTGAVTYTTSRNSQYGRVDQELAGMQSPAGHVLKGLQFGRGFPPSVSFPPGTFAAFVDASGKHEVGFIVRGYDGDKPPAPKLPADLGGADHGSDPRLFSTGAVDGSSLRYRVVAQDAASVDPDLVPPDDGPYQLVVAAPLTEVDRNLHQLLITEVLVALGVALALGLISWWLVRRELRPLEEISTTAGAIAAGDLTQRVPEGDPRTEVGHLGVSLNVMLTQIEQAFAERKASEDRLRRFLADASHELRTPLTSIRGYAELFRRGASENEEDLEKSMRRIEDESARMGVMVEDLLLLARLDARRQLDREPVDLGALCADAVADARVADPKREIDLTVDGPVVVLADEARLRQVAANLLSNAMRHTPAGTPVSVRVAAEDGAAVLEVVDRGPGLSDEQARRAFEPFYRADPSRDRTTGGAGLGLSIVQAIAEAHGGGVELRATPGGGATFRVVIPLGVGEPPASRVGSEPAVDRAAPEPAPNGAQAAAPRVPEPRA